MRQGSDMNFDECTKCTICTVYCPLLPFDPKFPGPKQAGPDGERYRLKDPSYYDPRLKSCLNCKRCEVVCPSGVKVADLIQEARMNHSASCVSLRDRILSNTEAMGRLARPVAAPLNALMSTGLTKSLMHSVMGVHKDSRLPKYASKGFREWFARKAEPFQGRFSKKVALYHGCSTEFQHPEVGKACVGILNACGFGVELLDERCCSIAKIANGLYDSARDAARHNLQQFEAARGKGMPIVTLSSTCTLTIRDEYPSLLGVDTTAVRESIMLIEKFLYQRLLAGDLRLAFKPGHKRLKIFHHVPCHLLRLGWAIYTRSLFELSPMIESFTVSDDLCCGMAGTYGFKKENHAVSKAIGAALFDRIKASDSDVVITECETCKWQIESSVPHRVENPVLTLYNLLDLSETARLNGVSLGKF